MNNSLIDIIMGKERKRYNQIIQLIDQKNYRALFDMDRNHSFGLSNQEYINRILDRIEQEVLNNPEFIIQMNQSYYHRASHFNEIAIKSNPKIIEDFIEQNILGADKLISMALDNGYIPSNDYINSHLSSFSSAEVMGKLVDGGYRPTNEMMESYRINNNSRIKELEKISIDTEESVIKGNKQEAKKDKGHKNNDVFSVMSLSLIMIIKRVLKI